MKEDIYRLEEIAKEIRLHSDAIVELTNEQMSLCPKVVTNLEQVITE